MRPPAITGAPAPLTATVMGPDVWNLSDCRTGPADASGAGASMGGASIMMDASMGRSTAASGGIAVSMAGESMGMAASGKGPSLPLLGLSPPQPTQQTRNVASAIRMRNPLIGLGV